jgi:RNA polymerase sigma-70 factor (ECF subfamily)
LRENPGPAAIEESYRTHKDRLLTLAAAFLGDRAAAEDVVHDVFASLLAGKGRSRNGTGVAAYLTACVRNRAIDVLRKGGGASVVSADVATFPDRSRGAADALPADEAHLLLKSVSALPDELREAVSLRIWGELTFEEIARLLSVTKSTAHDRYRQALEKLRFGIHGEVQR